MTGSRRPGRPRLAEPRDKVIGVRFTRAEVAAIESAAQSEQIDGGQTAGEWIRRRVLETLGLG